MERAWFDGMTMGEDLRKLKKHFSKTRKKNIKTRKKNELAIKKAELADKACAVIRDGLHTTQVAPGLSRADVRQNEVVEGRCMICWGDLTPGEDYQLKKSRRHRSGNCRICSECFETMVEASKSMGRGRRARRRARSTGTPYVFAIKPKGCFGKAQIECPVCRVKAEVGKY